MSDERKPIKDSTLAAAVVSGLAVVAAAYVQVTGGRTEPTPTPSATTTPTPTPSATPTPLPLAELRGPLHEIHMDNDCPKPFSIMIHYFGANGWTNNNGTYWEYTHGESDTPTFQDKRLMTDRDDIYIYAKQIDGSLEWSGNNFVTVKGQQIGFRSAAVDRRVNGDYAVHLTCDEVTPTATPTP